MRQENPLIQDMVLCEALTFLDQDVVPIHAVRVAVLNRYGCNLSYKQARDAFFRLRDRWPVKHIGGGFYKWDL